MPVPTQVPSTWPRAFTFVATAFQPNEAGGPNAWRSSQPRLMARVMPNTNMALAEVSS